MGSLKPTLKEVTLNPAKNAVTRPTDPAARDASVTEKLEFYSLLQAFKRGKVPSNQQLDEFLNYLIHSLDSPSREVSDETKKLIIRVKDILITTKRGIQDKNEDHLMQSLFSKAFSFKAPKMNKGSDTNVPKDQISSEASELLAHFKALGKLIVSNGEIRKLLKDVVLVAREMFSDVAGEASGLARPSEKAYASVDKEASEKFVNEDTKETRDKAKNKLKGIVNSKKTKDFKQKTKDIIKKQLPKERQKNFINRLKKSVVECQSDDKYNKAIVFLLDRIEHWLGISSERAGGLVKSNVSSFRKNETVNEIENDFVTLTERFANNRSLTPTFKSVSILRKSVENDRGLREWVIKAKDFVRRTLLEPGYVTDHAQNDGEKLYDDGTEFWGKNGKYSADFRNVFDNLASFSKGFSQDKVNKQFGKDVQKLSSDLFKNSSGKFSYKPDVFSDLKTVLLPALANRVGYVPIPRIEFRDEKIEMVIENLILDAPNILPNVVEIEAKNWFRLSPFKGIPDSNRHSTHISLSQIQMDIKDIAFYFRKKTSPRISDQGLLDVVLSGKGLSTAFNLVHYGGDRDKNTFRAENVSVNVDHFDFHVRNNKHSFLVKLFRPLARSLIKKAIEKGLRQAIIKGVEDSSSKLSQVYKSKKAKRASKDSAANPKAALAQQQKQVKQKSENENFKLSIAPPETYLVNWHSQNSMISRMQALSAKSDGSNGWKSSAFDVVKNKPQLSFSALQHSKANAVSSRTRSSVSDENSFAKEAKGSKTLPVYNNESGNVISNHTNALDNSNNIYGNVSDKSGTGYPSAKDTVSDTYNPAKDRANNTYNTAKDHVGDSYNPATVQVNDFGAGSLPFTSNPTTHSNRPANSWVDASREEFSGNKAELIGKHRPDIIPNTPPESARTSRFS